MSKNPPSQNKGDKTLEADLSDLFRVLSGKGLVRTKKALADKRISESAFEKVFPSNALRLAFWLMDPPALERILELSPSDAQSLQKAKILVQKHLRDLTKHPTAATLFKKEVEANRKDESGIPKLTGLQTRLFWNGRVPNLTPSLEVQFRSGDETMFKLPMELSDLVFLFSSLSKVLRAQFEDNVVMADHKLIKILGGELIFGHLMKSKTDLEVAMALAPKLGITVASPTPN